MNTILIDVNGIERISALANAISDELNVSSTIVNRLADHDEWNCKEKDEVVEKTQAIKNGFAQLAELSGIFASEMQLLKSEFESFSSLVPNKMAETNTLLGQSYAIKSSSVDAKIGTNTVEAATLIAGMPVAGGMENYALANTTQPICACSFEDLDYSAALD